MSGKRLTLEERLQVACYHSSGSKHPQWVVDPGHGHSVCSYCGKPSAQTVLRICSECDDEFVVPLDSNWLPKYFIVAGEVFERFFECSSCY